MYSYIYYNMPDCTNNIYKDYMIDRKHFLDIKSLKMKCVK
jgi:hypothetical protein